MLMLVQECQEFMKLHRKNFQILNSQFRQYFMKNKFECNFIMSQNPMREAVENRTDLNLFHDREFTHFLKTFEIIKSFRELL